MKIYLNDRFVEESEAHVSVFDHGLLYGDGIFEGIRLYEGNVFRLQEHLERLARSAKAIYLDLPWSLEELSEIVCESCRVNGLRDGYIRLIVTRGKGSLGISIKSCASPQLIVIADSITLYPKELYTKGIRAVTVPTRRNSHGALPPMVKGLNYLNNILAKTEAEQAGCQEAIMLNDQGYVAECAADNLFIVQKGRIYTPEVSAGSLVGITRQAVMDIAVDLGLACEEVNLTRYDLWVAEECFGTGTAAEVIPVVEIDHRSIGSGKPGPLTGKILEKFREQVRTVGLRI